MRRQRFYTENFGGVMSPEQEIHPKLVGCHCRPMRRLPRDKCVDSLLRKLVDFRPAPPVMIPIVPVFFGPNMKAFTGPVECFLQFAIDFIARQGQRAPSRRSTDLFLQRTVELM